jgi:hypothetical protein
VTTFIQWSRPFWAKGMMCSRVSSVFVKQIAAVGADVAVAREQLAVGQAGTQVEGVDVGHAAGADDAVDRDDRLLTRDGVVPAAEDSNLLPGFPAHLLGGVVDHRLLQRYPRLRQPWADSFKTFTTRLLPTVEQPLTRNAEVPGGHE